ncbi:hypothetical protein EDD11_005437 [Mortierella claussenii]|nr:hypothetical protein EDD11_005437 [Mortierella claussenii]
MTTVRAYSSKTKTKLQIESAKLEQEIRQLEKTITDQERKVASKRAYNESIRESKQRSDAAKSVYKNLTSPIASTSSASSTTTVASRSTKQIAGRNSNAQSYLPQTFLEDMNLSYLDTRGSKKSTMQQLQSGLPSTEELKAVSLSGLSGSLEDGAQKEEEVSLEAFMATAENEGGALTPERVRKLGINNWNKLIYLNALEGNHHNAEQVMQLMHEVGAEPNMESFSYLMEAYSNAGRLKKAQSTIELMLQNGLIPTMSSYNSLMSLHVRKRDLTSAFKVFEALKKHHSPDVDVFTNLIKGCLRAEEYDLGWKVFDQMQRSGATPVESTYSLMIHACAKTDQVEKALDIFKTYPSRRLQPTDSTFNSLIHACAIRPEYFATAFALLNEMQNIYGFEPDISTYNTLLFACSKRRDLLTARRVFQKVVQLDSEGVLRLDGITVTNFMWCVTEWKDMKKHIQNMKMRRLSSLQGQTDAATAIVPTSESTIASATPAVTTSTTVTDISVRPTYFMLPERPPKDEYEALAEGESVFSWFVSRNAEQIPSTDSGVNPEVQPFLTDSEVEKQATVTTTTTTTATTTATANSGTTVSDVALPRVPPRSQIRTRLLNAYLAMYVRHMDMDRSTQIYRHYFPHFGLLRDSWTYSTMLEGCYHWKNVDLGAEVFRDWRSWRKSTGKLTEKWTRQSDYACYRRMINLLARTNHLDESVALLEELSIAATPVNTRLRAEIESAKAAMASSSSSSSSLSSSSSDTTSEPNTETSASASPSLSSASSPASASTSTSTALSITQEIDDSLAFLKPLQQESVLPIYPQLKHFPLVYTKTWELENEGARKLLLRLCHGKVDSLTSGPFRSSTSEAEDQAEDPIENDTNSIMPHEDKRRARYQKSLRNTAIKWKGEHPQEKGFYVGSRRIRELDQNLSKRGQDRHRR